MVRDAVLHKVTQCHVDLDQFSLFSHLIRPSNKEARPYQNLHIHTDLWEPHHPNKVAYDCSRDRIGKK